MKAVKITYWASTVVIALMMGFSAYAYLSMPAMELGFQHLGYPNHFRIELAIAKLIGAVLLLLPVSARIKEWAYAGFAFTFVAAFVAHTASGDPVSARVMPFVMLLILLTSYTTYYRQHKLLQQKVA